LTFNLGVLSWPAVRSGSPKTRGSEGLTLVETALVVSVVGVVLAVFVPTFISRLETSKIAEAAEQLADLHMKSAAYFDTPHRAPNRATKLSCLPEPAGPAPQEPSTERVIVDFTHEAIEGHGTFDALGYRPEVGLRYRYTFEPEEAGCGLVNPESGALLVLRAEGDLDGDGDLSVFERHARVDDNGRLVPVGALFVRDRVE